MALAVKRRRYLRYLGASVLGAGGYAVMGGDVTVPAWMPEPSEAMGPPPTETEIASANIDHGPFARLTLYESGAAEMTFEEGHGVDRFGLTHDQLNLQDEPLQAWETPRFTGPKVIDLKSIIQRNGPYPNNKFKFGVMADLYIGVDKVTFHAPQSWMPE